MKLDGLHKDISLEEALKIIQELQADKQELEIKNEGLRKTHLELDYSHDKYFDLYNFAPIGYLTLNEKGFITEANLTAANLLAISKNDLINTSFTKYIFKDDQDKYYHYNRNILAGKLKHQLEIRIKREDDSYYWIRMDTILSMRENDGIHHLKTLIDISEQKKYEEELIKSRKLLSETGKMGKVGGWEFDINTKKQIWTEETHNIHEVSLTYEPDVEKGVNFYTPESRPLIEKALQRAIEHGESFDLELEIITAKGNHKYVNAIGRADSEKQRVYGFFQDITDKKIAAEAETTFRKQLKKILDLVPSYIFAKDYNGKFLMVNKSLADLFKVSPEEIAGKTDADYGATEEQIEGYLEADRNVIDSGKELFIKEERVLRKDGSLGWFQTHKIPYQHPGKEEQAILGVAVDITERKEAEIAMKESNELLSLFLKHSPIYAFIKEVNQTESRVLKASDNFEQMLGIPGYMMEGKTMNELFPADLAANMTADDWEIVSKGKELTLNEEFNGRYYTSIKFPILKDGRVLLAGYSFDITKQKFAEDALKESEEKYRLLHESLMDAFVKVDNEGYILESNESFRNMVGYNENELSELTYMDLTPDKWWNIESEIVENQIKAKGYSDVYEKEYIRKDGTVFPVELRAFLLKNKDSKPNSFWAIARDITERKKAEEEIRNMNEELSTINAEKDKFFSIIAHDLRSPFTGFIGFTDLLKNDLQSMPIAEMQNIVNGMNQSANNLFRLLTNLLEWAKIQRGMAQFNPQEILLNKLSDRIINVFYEYAKIKEIELVMDMPDDIYVYADKAMLETIIRNLVSNAIKFTPKGGKVIITASKTDEMAEISVKDTGIGMSKEMLEDLFRIDVRPERKGTEQEPGSGLGLILCKEFAELHKGKITVESNEGKGSEFKVYFKNN